MSMQNQNMSLVLSTDAKPRLKWTPELHQRFIEAVNHLGGPDKATPKSLTRVMGIPGLTLYHLKSHLQKYRLGKSEQSSETSIDNKQEDYREIQSRDMQYFISSEISDATPNQINESLQMAQALQMQMEVQRKLYEQIEVQRHLQLRIEAQGKYLQSVLKKAQETLAGYSSSSLGVELAKAELSRLVSMVNTGCPSSPISELTETRDLTLKDHIERKQLGGTICSTESSLTSSESSGRKEEKQPKTDTVCVELPLINIHPEDRPRNREPSTQTGGRKRSGSTISDGNCVELPSGKRSPNYKNEKVGLSTMLALNSQYQNDIDSGSKAIDLNDSVTSVLEP